jgi:CubicO group peptidase (beta-lactamase class C family)
VSGLGPGEFFAREVAGPLGLDFWIGLPAEQEPRVAPLTNTGPRRADGRPDEDEGDGTSGLANLVEMIEEFLGPDALLAKALGGCVNMPFIGNGVFNNPEVRAAVLPAANGVTNARSLARMYAAVIGPVPGGPAAPLLTPEQLAAATTTQTNGADKVLMFDSTFGLGFMTASPFTPYGTPGGFGHSGAGGSAGFADPNHGLGFGYVMNRTLANLAGDPRSRGLIEATYRAIGVEPAFL